MMQSYYYNIGQSLGLGWGGGKGPCRFTAKSFGNTLGLAPGPWPWIIMIMIMIMTMMIMIMIRMMMT